MSDSASASVESAPRETKHAMKMRHKQELKALLGKPAKGIGAKKKQKEEAAALEAKHAEELKELERREQEAQEQEEGREGDDTNEAASNGDSAAAASAVASSTSTVTATPAPRGPSRAAHKKAARAAKEAARMAELRAEAELMTDFKGEENKSIEEKLKNEGLTHVRVKEMVSDGHCLYRALADQLILHPTLTSTLPHIHDSPQPFHALRRLAASELREHKEEFLPFLEDESGKPVETDEEFEQYVERVEAAMAAESDSPSPSSPSVAWGGHAEIVALSKALRCPIHIWSASGKMTVGEEFMTNGNADSSSSTSSASTPAALHISFHKHYYGLGNHYNSVVPLSEEEKEELLERQQQ